MSKIIKFVLFILLFFLTFCFSSLLKVYFIDVGQGDAAFIITPNNYTILVDAGDRDEFYDYGKDVYSFIKDQLKINKINVALISHPHKDHIGGMIYILSNMKVEKFYDPGFPYPSLVYFELLEIVNKKKIKYYLARGETYIDLDPQVEIKILYPPKNFVFDTPNDNSVVLRIRYKEISVLFTGDIEANAEKVIVKKYKNRRKEISSNILKVPHHGSSTSSTYEFIKLVEPEVAIISCGRNNRFGHPHYRVLRRYEDYGVEIFRTDIDGTIEVIIDGEDYKINKFMYSN